MPRHGGPRVGSLRSRALALILRLRQRLRGYTGTTSTNGRRANDSSWPRMRCAPASETAPHRYSEDSRFTSLLTMPLRNASTSSLSRRGQRAPGYRAAGCCRWAQAAAAATAHPAVAGTVGIHALALGIGTAVQARGLCVGDARQHAQRQQQQQEGKPDHARRVTPIMLARRAFSPGAASAPRWSAWPGSACRSAGRARRLRSGAGTAGPPLPCRMHAPTPHHRHRPASCD